MSFKIFLYELLVCYIQNLRKKVITIILGFNFSNFNKGAKKAYLYFLIAVLLDCSLFPFSTFSFAISSVFTSLNYK